MAWWVCIPPNCLLNCWHLYALIPSWANSGQYLTKLRMLFRFPLATHYSEGCWDIPPWTKWSPMNAQGRDLDREDGSVTVCVTAQVLSACFPFMLWHTGNAISIAQEVSRAGILGLEVTSLELLVTILITENDWETWGEDYSVSQVQYLRICHFRWAGVFL